MVAGKKMSRHDEHHAPAACENCHTPLQGEFCHACGQSVHSPIRHAAHALEEIFESFWHLDGRIFRTLRDLLAPGRVARNYLAGHRARYVAPLRLFVIVSVLTFFVAQFTLNFGLDATKPIKVEGVVTDVPGKFSKANTVAEVVAMRDADLATMREARARTGPIPGVSQGMEAAIAMTQAQAKLRISQLDPTGAEARKLAAADADVQATPPPKKGNNTQLRTDLSVDPAKPWNEKTNPLKVSGLPAFANRWLNRQIAHGRDNIERYQEEPELFTRAALSAIPSALFMLVPVFALLLKGLYIGTRRLYLEHLVVALYSHVFLCLALLTLFVLVGLDNWLTPQAAWFGWVTGLLEFALWCWMPAYLLLMQKRVYEQRWWLTLLKYSVLGLLYFVLLSFATLFVVIVSVVKA